MDAPGQHSLFGELATVRAGLLDRIDGADLKLWVNEKTGRRIIDIVAHLAQWEVYASMCLEAYASSGEFRLRGPFKIDDANQRVFEMHRSRTDGDILSFFEASRERLLAAAEAIPLADWGGPLRYPWGAEGSVDELVLDMKVHDEHHAPQIQQALQSEGSPAS